MKEIVIDNVAFGTASGFDAQFLFKKLNVLIKKLDVLTILHSWALVEFYYVVDAGSRLGAILNSVGFIQFTAILVEVLLNAVKNARRRGHVRWQLLVFLVILIVLIQICGSTLITVFLFVAILRAHILVCILLVRFRFIVSLIVFI